MDASSRGLFTCLDSIARDVDAGAIGSWNPDEARFAGVAIVPVQPEPSPPGFYPEDRYVVTRHVGQVAWLFSRFVECFHTVDGYGVWKEDLFGRLGNAANWYVAANPDATDRELCLAVVVEAYQVADEVAWSGGQVAVPLLVVDNRVLDDALDPLAAGRPLTPVAVREALTVRGVL